MPIDQDKLYDKIILAFPDAQIDIIDLVGDKDHYKIEIKSNLFINKNKVTQHKMVNTALKDCLGSSLHALQIKTSIKEEK